ncbi:MAG TPA: hypothetical protein ENI07_16025 [Desulfobacterales bacterium]|nr:hypothetical protein [Desulfobacterales bacterium]
MRECGIVGCRKKHLAKGFCKLHYQRQYLNLPIEGDLGKATKELSGARMAGFMQMSDEMKDIYGIVDKFQPGDESTF